MNMGKTWICIGGCSDGLQILDESLRCDDAEVRIGVSLGEGYGLFSFCGSVLAVFAFICFKPSAAVLHQVNLLLIVGAPEIAMGGMTGI